METTEHLLQTPDGHQFKATLFLADHARATLIFLPALGTPARVYTRFATAMAIAGISTWVADWRGMASSTLRASRKTDYGYCHLLEQDIPAVLAAARATAPDVPLWVGGHSLGGQLSLLTAGSQNGISGALLVASSSVHLPNYSPKLKAGILSLIALSRVSKLALGYFPGDKLGFGGREARSLMRDWANVALTGHYLPDAATDYEHAMRAYQGHLLALNFDDDHWSPAAAARALIDKAPQANSVHWCWSRTDTDNIPLDHFSWTKNVQLVCPRIAQHIVHASTSLSSSTNPHV
jgi:predicted alpha/beta hydrolase